MKEFILSKIYKLCNCLRKYIKKKRKKLADLTTSLQLKQKCKLKMKKRRSGKGKNFFFFFLGGVSSLSIYLNSNSKLSLNNRFQLVFFSFCLN